MRKTGSQSRQFSTNALRGGGQFKTANGTFFDNEPRTFTGHVLYGDKDADYNGEMHEMSRSQVPLDKLDIDAYEEGKYVEMRERQSSIDQFRSDVLDHRLAERLRKNWRSEANTTRPLHSELEQQHARLREETLRALRQSRQQESLFDADYLRAVPESVRWQFSTFPQTEQVCAALVPMLIAQNAPGTAHQTHVTEEAMKRVLFASGCSFVSSHPETVDGHVSRHEPRLTGVGAHAHYDTKTKTTPVRVLTFSVPPDNYRVRVVCHRVFGEPGGEELLCFRTFHFLQPQQ